MTQNTGTITGYTFAGANGSLINFGTVTGGVVAGYPSWYVGNEAGGTILGHTPFAATAPGAFYNAGLVSSGYTYGIKLTDGGTVTNAVFGSIHAGGVGVYISASANGPQGTVLNAGTITGNYGVVLSGALTNTASGVIKANTGVSLRSVATGTLWNAGYISGAVISSRAAVVTNNGTIKGRVVTGGGVLTNAGTISNSSGISYAVGTSGGTVLNTGTIIGTRLAAIKLDAAGTVFNAGAVIGNSFTRVVGVGTLRHTASYSAKGVVFYGTSGASRLIETPSATLVGGATATAAAYLNTLELASGASAGALYGVGTSIKGFGTIAIDPSATWTIGGALNGETITGLAVGDVLDFASVAATSYAYANGTLALLANGTVAASVALPASYLYRPYIASDGAGGTRFLMHTPLAGTYASGLVLGSGRTAAGPTAVISSPSGSAVTQMPGTVATFTNQGLIESVDTVTGAGVGIGVDLLYGGAFVNAAGGRVYGAGGVYDDGGTVINHGTIGISPFSGTVVPRSGAGVYLSHANLYNATNGRIVNYNGAPANGVFGWNAAATVVNAGYIGLFDAGIDLEFGGVVTNASSGFIYGGNQGVRINGGTLVNAGTIKGLQAVAFSGSANRLVVQSGAVFNGQVAGGGGATIELGTNSSSQTITGFGTAFTGFGTIVFDPASTWTVNGRLSGETVVNFGTTETLDFAGVNAAFAAFSGGMLRLFNTSGASVASISLPGTVQVPVLSLSPDGTGGTRLQEPTAITSGVTLHSGAAYVAAFQTVTNYGSVAVTEYAGSTASLTNAGTISGSGGVSLQSGGAIANLAGGTITGTSIAGVAVAGGPGTVTNAGLIVGQTSGVSFASGGSLSNAAGGTITGVDAITIAAAATVTNAGQLGAAANDSGIWATGPLAFTNKASGQVTGRDGVVTFAGGTVTNGGTINARDWAVYVEPGGLVTNLAGGTLSASLATSKGVQILGGTGTVVNAGAISGGSDGVLLSSGGSVGNAAGGTVAGGIYGIAIAGGAGTVTNAGTIAGTYAAVLFAAGRPNRLIIDPGAVFAGAVKGGGSVIELGTGTAAGTLSGLGSEYTGFGSIAIDPSATWSLGSPLGANYSLTNAGTITGQVSIASGRVTNLQGAVIQAAAADSAGVLFTKGPGTIENAGTIAGAAAARFAPGYANRLIVDPGAVFSGNVNGAGAALELGSGTAAGTLAGLGTQYAGFTALSVDAGARWTVGGSGSLVATLAAAATLANQGTLNGIDLTGSGDATNAASGLIAGSYIGIYGASTDSVINAGSIDAFGRAVEWKGGGSLANQAGGRITSGFIGLYTQGAATVTNAGYIQGAHQGANMAGGTVNNSGTITGATGLALSAFAAVTNTGLITGSADGIDFGAGGTATNQAGGTIQSSGTAGLGISVVGGAGTVENAGTITGASGALRFAADYANRLIVDPGAVFLGTASGGGGILELKSASSAGTLSGLGSQYTGFSGIAVDAGAAWTVAGSAAVQATLAAAATLTNQGTLTSVSLAAAGAVTNGSGALLTGGSSGILASGAATLVNAGAINASVSGILLNGGGTATNAVGGLIRNAYIGIEAAGTTAAIANAGSIDANGRAVELKAGGTLTNQAGGRITSGFIGVYTQGAATVTNAGYVQGAHQGANMAGGTLVNQSGGTVTGNTGIAFSSAAYAANAGLVTGTATGIDFGAGGTLTVQSGGTVSGADAVSAEGAATIANAGEIDGSANGILLSAGGSASNTGLIRNAYVGISAANAAATVVNSGSIDATGRALQAKAGGALTNQAGGRITSGFIGVYAQGTTTLTNAGYVQGAHQGANLAGGSVGNTGTVTGVTGIALSASGTVTNAGVISGSATGIDLGAGGTLVNLAGGSINGGNAATAEGATTLTNAGTISGTGNAVLFAGGSNRVIVDPGAVFAGTVNGGSGAALELASGSGAGTLSGLGSQFLGFGTLAVDAHAAWTLAGANTLSAAQGTLDPTSTLTNAGTLTLIDTTLSGGGALVNNGTVVLDPSSLTVGDLGGSGAVTIEAGSTLTVNGTVAAGETIVFAGTAAVLDLASPGAMAGTIQGFDKGDTLGLSGLLANSASLDVSAGKLTFDLIAGGSGTIALPGVGALSTTIDAGLLELTALCFLPGTMIRTPSGDVPVQRLAVGDTVRTWSGNARRVVWIGRGKVLATRGRRGAATPVIVRKGALAPNVPAADLRVTKGHALLLDEVLIPVEFLVNHRSIEWDDRAQEVELYHIELDAHDVLVANGAPAESYRDDGNRWLFQNANTGWDLPAQAPCATVLTGGPIVDRVWRRLLDRAGARPGLPMTRDPDPHLIADGKPFGPCDRYQSTYRFRLPEPPRSLVIRSRASVPAEHGLARDFRSLGIAVRQITFSQKHTYVEIRADDPLLTDGFHAFEADQGIRWTSGDAVIPTAALSDMKGPIEALITLGGETSYPLLAAHQAA